MGKLCGEGGVNEAEGRGRQRSPGGGSMLLFFFFLSVF